MPLSSFPPFTPSSFPLPACQSRRMSSKTLPTARKRTYPLTVGSGACTGSPRVVSHPCQCSGSPRHRRPLAGPYRSLWHTKSPQSFTCTLPHLTLAQVTAWRTVPDILIPCQCGAPQVVCKLHPSLWYPSMSNSFHFCKPFLFTTRQRHWLRWSRISSDLVHPIRIKLWRLRDSTPRLPHYVLESAGELIVLRSAVC